MNFFRRLFNDKGEEMPDPTPIEIDAGLKRPLTLQEQIRRLVRDETVRHALAQDGIETFEEADDFNVGDDFDPTSPYEEDFDKEVPFIGARIGETRGMMVEEKPLKESHKRVLADAKAGKYAKKAETISDPQKPQGGPENAK